MTDSPVQSAHQEAQLAHERRLNEVRWRLARRPWLIPALATVLEWPGGRVGVRAILRELAELGEAEEREGGEWHATPALKVPGRTRRPQRPHPRQTQEADMATIPQEIEVLLAKRPWLTGGEIAQALRHRGASASSAASKMAIQGRLQRRRGQHGRWEYALASTTESNAQETATQAAHDQVMAMQQAGERVSKLAAENAELRRQLATKDALLAEEREGAKGIDQALTEAGVAVGTPARTLVERIQVLGAMVAEDEVSDEVVTELREQLGRERERADQNEAEAERVEGLVEELEQTRLERDNWRTGAEQLAANLEAANRKLEEERERGDQAEAELTAAREHVRRVEEERGQLRRQLEQGQTAWVQQTDRVTELERERDELYTAMGPGPGMTHTQAVNYATQLVDLGKRACERAQETAALDAADAHRVRELEQQVRDIKGALNQATTRHEQLHNALADALLTGMRESSDEVLVDQVRETNAQLENVHAERDDALQRVNALEQQVSPLQRQTALLTQAFRVAERLRLQEMARQRAAQAGAEVGHRFAEQLADVTVRLFNCVLMVEGDVRDTTPLGLAIELQRHLQKQLAARSEAT